MVKNRQTFDKAYSDKTYNIGSVYDHIIRIRHRYLNDLDGNKLFDHGFGNGINALYFMDEGFSVSGVDVSETAVAKVTSLLTSDVSAQFQLVSPDQSVFPFEGASFDAIVSNQVLYFIPDREQINQTISEFFRLLKPGGKVVATVMAEDNCYFTEYASDPNISEGVVSVTVRVRINRDFELYKFARKESLGQAFVEAGFEIDSIGYFDYQLFDTGCAKHYIVCAYKPLAS